MSAVSRIWNQAFTRIKAEPRRPLTPIRIPDTHIEPAASPNPPPPDVADGGDSAVIQEQKDYVTITLDQMFLANARAWWRLIEPSVFASTEFLYDGKDRTDPVVIGPRPDDKLPPGMVIRNRTLFGPHPYRGGAFTFTFVLSQLPVGNMARQVLDVVAATSSALAPTIGIETYAKMSGVVLDGFETLMGLNGVKPLIGWQETINPDRGEPFRPGRWALIDTETPRQDQFWVIGDDLWHGRSRATAQPYRDEDFMLFQFSRAPDGRRSGVDQLPFYPTWKNAQASASNAAQWETAKTNFAAMVSAIDISPDLTWNDGRALKEERRARLVELHAAALADVNLASGAWVRSTTEDEIASLLRLP